MKNTFLTLSALVASIFIASCGAPAGNNGAPANKPANTGNTATTTADPAAAEAEVRRLMADAAVALAKNDADAMDKIYADNYMLVNLDGSVQTRAERLASLRSGDAKYSAFSYSDASVRISPGGDDAVVIAKLTMKGVFRGKPTDGDFRVTQVYARTKDGWKQISAQATKIEAGAKADDKHFEKEDSADKMPAANKAPTGNKAATAPPK